MTFALVRETNVGGAAPALTSVASQLATSLADLRLAVDTQAAALQAALDELRPLALGDLEAQLGASLQAVAALEASISDPSVYLAGLLAGVVSVEANLSALVPTVALSGQLDAALEVSATVGVKVGALRAALDALSLAIEGLRAAIAGVLSVLDLYAALLSALLTPGASVYRFEGDVGDFGAEADATVALSGAAKGVVVLTQTAAARAALSAVFEV